MKKRGFDSKLFNSEPAVNRNLSAHKVLTTDINILLNRVRLDEKRDLRKKITFTFILLLALGVFIFLTII